MSPRAAWRLEAFGYPEVYDYVAGKSDWMAAGLPTEGNSAHPPRVDTRGPLPCGTLVTPASWRNYACVF